jgi:hypothetical protein
MRMKTTAFSPGRWFLPVLVAFLATCNQTSAQNNRCVDVGVETIAGILKKFSASPRDSGNIITMREMAAKNGSPYLPLLNMLLSLACFSAVDTFAEANKYTQKAVASVRSLSDKKTAREAFHIKPSIEYFGLLGPSENQMKSFEKKPYLLLPYARVLYGHAEVFYRLELRQLLYETVSCFRAVSRRYYATRPEIKEMDDRIKLWSIELNMNLPD